ncbi:uncharacterized protein LOC141532637 [Cotesia typhae]|uniref:uncharacterized protein LOC141532637 n=1 Tax=Cotesia typhae TaxID=2053667 RepID=UPI003D68EDD9
MRKKTLALLPSPDIIQTFNWLIRIHAPFYPIFKTFITYFEDYWLNNIKPAGFSVYKLKNRTNNYTEAYHRRLKRFFGEHSSICLRDFHGITKIEIQSLLLSLPTRRASRTKNTVRAEALDRAWEWYDANVLDIPRFLEYIAHISPIFRNKNMQINIGDINNFINTPIYRYITVPDNQYIVFNNDAANYFKYISYEH